MTTKTRVTKAEATKTLNAVKRMFRYALGKGSTGPTLIKDWTWGWTTEHTYEWAIVWEEGPYDWAHLFPYGGRDEEFGFKHDEVAIPDGTWTECITGWAIAVYPKDW